jgi:hypothetical protein
MNSYFLRNLQASSRNGGLLRLESQDGQWRLEQT